MIVCDNCGNSPGSERHEWQRLDDMAPPGWLVVLEQWRDANGNPVAKLMHHFCSEHCLLGFGRKTEGGKTTRLPQLARVGD